LRGRFLFFVGSFLRGAETGICGFCGIMVDGLRAGVGWGASMGNFSKAVSNGPLGARIGLFKPALGNVVAVWGYGLLWLGIAAFVVWVAVAVCSEKPSAMDWVCGVTAVVFSVAACVHGAAWMRSAHGSFSHEVELCENGFSYLKGPSRAEVTWQDVALIRETLWRPGFPTYLPGPGKGGTSYAVITKGGVAFGFDRDSLAEIKRFGALLHERAALAGVPWEKVDAVF